MADLEAELGNFLRHRLPTVKGRLVLGYSGGVDSSVLLALLVKLRQPSWPALFVVHVHHGLQPAADAWAEHCLQHLQEQKVDGIVIRVQVKQGPSLEAQARTARRHALASQLQSGDVLLLAHHADDQAETLLFRMLRGTGIDGWTAMRLDQEIFPSVPCWRPLLNLRKNQLIQWATANSLHWVEDNSNADTHYDRNYLRQVLMPQIEMRWPRAVEHLLALTDEVQELKSWVQTEEAPRLAQILDHQKLHLERLAQTPPALQSRLIRAWLAQLHAPVPERRLLQELLSSLHEKLPPRRWSFRGFEVIRYRQHLYGRYKPAIFQPSLWNPDAPLILPDGRIFHAHMQQGAGLLRPTDGIWLKPRQGHDHLQLNPGRPHHLLKKLFQTWAVPEFFRDEWPLLYLEQQLIAIPGYAIAAEFQTNADELGWKFIEIANTEACCH